MKMTNQRNRLVYRHWAPIYDATVNRIFMPGRRRALDVLALQPGERVLIVGVGTGEDLLLLRDGVEAVGIDISPEMLAKARSKIGRCLARVRLIEGDAQVPRVEEGPFDAAILNLILTVIPDGKACLHSTFQMLKPGARAVVFDKFLPEGHNPSPVRKVMNVFSTMLGTDINRRLDDMMRDCPCKVLLDEPSIAGGLYRVVLLCKDERAGSP
ncbi:MAG TPA: methyltransferase domain-containing protein [Anaerolineales bacterium]